jgi:hypothetical protein
MKVELTEQELQNTLVFLNRVDLKGHEAITLAVLLHKYTAALRPPAVPSVDADRT